MALETKSTPTASTLSPNPEEFPKTFDIDYIRVYQEKDTP